MTHSRSVSLSFLRFPGTFALIMGTVAAGAIAYSGWKYWNRPVLTFDQVHRALQRRKLPEAETLARGWLNANPDDVGGLVVLGEALQRQGKIDESIEVYQQLPFGTNPRATSAQLALVSLLLHQGRLAEAEQTLLRLKLNASQSPVADGLWVTLLSLSGRRWESLPYLQRALTSPGDPFMKLIYLANPDEMPAPPDDVFARMYRVRDPLGALGCGRVAASMGRFEQAAQLANETLSQRPELVEALVLQGLVLLDQNDLEEFDRWNQQLPSAAEAHPGIWFLRGRRAQDAGQSAAAMRCYWETLRRQPNHDRATYQLGQLLSAAGRLEEAAPFLLRAKKLTRLIELAVRMFKDRGSISENAECADLTYELGRLHEALVWCEKTLVMSPDHARMRELMRILQAELTASTPWLLPAADVAAHIDLSDLPLPSGSTILEGSPRGTGEAPLQAAEIHWVDDAENVGLQFIYFNGDDETSEGKRMFEYTGGGVAAFDYDRDGWCDLYFTQGTDWPPRPDNHQYVDQLYRNLAGQRMQSVTAHCGILDVGFGQGVSAGDFDNDGFADLYVANIDGNRLYQNQGDGTFRDVTLATRIPAHDHWTTSCLIADLDGDALPDLFDVTFLEGDDIFSRICRGDDGRPRSCAPAGFSAAMDYVYRNRGDGTFEDVTAEWGFDVPNGDGLGIVAADFDDSGRISLFVGNDGRPNFFFVPHLSSENPNRWNEVGLLSGLALDDSGAAQACMGIAAGDPNNDGRIDLFVTNFYNESNTLYINLGNRTFTDRARSAGLHDPSWSLLGFGTQFVDADLDGQQDIILVNGHVDDFSHKQIPYKMRPQFFQNIQPKHGLCRFQELYASQIGPFFESTRLGRGLARLDWNRDGLSDLAISHIGDNASLLTNTTRHAGNGLALQLVGTTVARDAIGTRVTLTAGAQQWTRQLTAGDGYQATNQRRIEFGIGHLQHDLLIEIDWSDGTTQRFPVTELHREYVAIQGTNALIPLNSESTTFPSESPRVEP